MRVRGSKYILIADDSNNSRLKMVTVLLTRGHKLNFAKDKREVVEHFNVEKEIRSVY
jgi:CheY-like chemotaxis protein